ncbi:UNVERIFIED_CONTAM: hypothetical protein NY603_21675, partial [Bacteroidetes bacterium 56_B9]
ATQNPSHCHVPARNGDEKVAADELLECLEEDPTLSIVGVGEGGELISPQVDLEALLPCDEEDFSLPAISTTSKNSGSIQGAVQDLPRLESDWN